MTALAAAPEELRAAARLLLTTRHDLSGVVTRIEEVSACTGRHWSGIASLEQQSRLRSLRCAVESLGGPLEWLAAEVSRLAEEVEQAQTVVRRVTAQREQVLRERALVAAQPVDPSDPVAAAWRSARLTELDEQAGVLAAELRRAEDDLALVEHRLAGRLPDLRPPGIPADLVTLGSGVYELYRAGRAARLGYQGATLLRLSVRVARSTGERTVWQLSQRVATLARTISNAPRWARWLRIPSPWGLVVTAGSPMFADLVRGSDYGDWRDLGTRVAGGVGLVGLAAVVVPIPVPHLKGAGAIAMGGYGGWKGGNWIYDNRRALQVLGTAAWRQAVRRAEELVERLDPARLGDLLPPTSPALPYGPLGPLLPPVIGARQAWERLADLVGRDDGGDDVGGKDTEQPARQRRPPRFGLPIDPPVELPRLRIRMPVLPIPIPVPLPPIDRPPPSFPWPELPAPGLPGIPPPMPFPFPTPFPIPLPLPTPLPVRPPVGPPGTEPPGPGDLT